MWRRTSSRSRTTSWPATCALPDVGLASVQSMLIVVVLPAPLGPRKPNTSPGPTANETPRTASISPNDFFSALTSIMRGKTYSRCKKCTIGVLMDGLRERKKRQTRDAIASAAMALFRARGYHAVTVADVARAADVSEKTVFNYFPTKEDLVFSRTDDRLAERAEAIRSRPAGVPLTRVFEAETMAFLDGIEAGDIDALM